MQYRVQSVAGKLMFNMLGAIADFKRDLINERTAEERERANSKVTTWAAKERTRNKWVECE